MDSIREYLIGVIAAAFLCGIVTSILDPKGMVGVAVKFVAGILLLLSVVQPWIRISWNHILDWTGDVTANGESFVTDGEIMAQDAYRKGIIQRTQAYIEDEAKALNCELVVEVILSDDTLPIPKQVRLTGEVSPYARSALSHILTDRLGIKQEDQIWT